MSITHSSKVFFIGLVCLVSQPFLLAQDSGAVPAELPPPPTPSRPASPKLEHTLEPPAFKAATPGTLKVGTPTVTPLPAESPSPTSHQTKTPETLEEAVNDLSGSELNEVLRLLKAAYVQPSGLRDEEILRGTVQGVLERLGPGATLLTAKDMKDTGASPFRAEILDDRIGYLRLGDLSKNNLSEMDAALSNFEQKRLHAAILDLRATPPSSDFELASEVVKRFVPKGKMLFTIRKPSMKQERMFTSNQDPAFFGLLAIVVDADTRGAPEVIAAVLRKEKNAMVIGESTAGQGVEYDDFSLQSGKKLRIAVSIVSLPDDATPIFPDGVKPEIPVEVPEGVTEEILAESLKSGISQFVFESERPRMNEAALVAGTNPDLEALQAAQENGENGNSERIYDRVLQRAVDLLTTIAIYERGGR